MTVDELSPAQRERYRTIGREWCARTLEAVPAWEEYAAEAIQSARLKGVKPLDILHSVAKQSMFTFTDMGLAVAMCGEDSTEAEQAEASVYFIAIRCMLDSDWRSIAVGMMARVKSKMG